MVNELIRMNSYRDEVKDITNPRLLTGTYFALLALIITIMTCTILYALGKGQYLPIYQAVLLAMVTGGLFGALFGQKIIYCKKPYPLKAFLLGFFMVIVALPFYILIFLYLFKVDSISTLFQYDFKALLIIYFWACMQGFKWGGIWLAIGAGIAAYYLRGYLVYDILHIETDKRR